MKFYVITPDAVQDIDCPDPAALDYVIRLTDAANDKAIELGYDGVFATICDADGVAV